MEKKEYNLEKKATEITNTPRIEGTARCSCGQYIKVKIEEGAHNAIYECPNGKCEKQYDIKPQLVMNEISKE